MRDRQGKDSLRFRGQLRFVVATSALTASVGLIAAALGLWGPDTARANTWPSRATKLERELGSPDIETRLLAARSAGSLSPSLARPLLKKALNDPEVTVRLVAARTATALGLADLDSLMTEWLKSKDAAERKAALDLLALHSTSEKVTLFGEALSDPAREVRLAAVLGLRQSRGEGGRLATPLLLGALDDADPSVRGEAAAALGMVGTADAALTMAAHLQDPEAQVRVQLALSVGVLGDASVAPALLVALSDQEDEVVAAAATGLGFLGSADAVAGLTALAEQVPFRESGKRAVESLIRLSGEQEQRVLLELLSRAEARQFIEGVLERADDRVLPFLRQCLKVGVGEGLLSCVRAGLPREEMAGPILLALDDGRLSSQQVLRLFSSHPTNKSTVLALEMLSSRDRDLAREALSYLVLQESLPKEAEGPLRDSLRADFWSTGETASLLGALARVDSKRPAPWALPYLDASSEDIQAKAAALLVARNARGKKLQDLLLHRSSLVQKAALEALGRGPTQGQAEDLIGLVASGIHGNKRALLSVFWAFPDRLSAPAIAKLGSTLEQARGADRDALLVPWVRAQKGAGVSSLLKQASLQDRLKLAQLAWYLPESKRWVNELAAGNEPRVQALALIALGLHGSSQDVPTLLKQARRDQARPTHVRAAAFTGLGLLLERKILKTVPKQVEQDACDSPHPGLRVAALRLFALAGGTCGTPLEEVVLLDSDARLRAAAAEILQQTNKDSLALRRCALYEPRVEVAASCGHSLLVGAPEAAPFTFPGQAPIAPVRLVPRPFERLLLTRESSGEGQILAPVAIRFSPADLHLVMENKKRPVKEGTTVFATVVSDRSGHLLLPASGAVPVDASFAY